MQDVTIPMESSKIWRAAPSKSSRQGQEVAGYVGTRVALTAVMRADSSAFRLLASLFCTFLLVACGSTTPAERQDKIIDASDYRSDCTLDTDCSLLQVGEVCGCGCDFAAISVADRDRASADHAAIDCSQGASPDVCGACLAVAVYCNAGTCATR